MGGQLPKPQPPKAQQIATVTAAVSTSTVISAALTAGTITQSRVNEIVTAAINNMRAGE